MWICPESDPAETFISIGGKMLERDRAMKEMDGNEEWESKVAEDGGEDGRRVLINRSLGYQKLMGAIIRMWLLKKCRL